MILTHTGPNGEKTETRTLENGRLKLFRNYDEHGQKVQDYAEAAGKSPQEFVDEIAPLYEQAWQRLNISNDDFIRTTEQRHKIGVAELLQRCYDAGDIELDVYKGKYCVACEEYYTDDELDPGDLGTTPKRPLEY